MMDLQRQQEEDQQQHQQNNFMNFQQEQQAAAFRQFAGMTGGGLQMADAAAGGNPFQSASLLDAETQQRRLSTPANPTDSNEFQQQLSGSFGGADQLGAAAAAGFLNPAMYPFAAAAGNPLFGAAQDPLLRANLLMQQQAAAAANLNNPLLGTPGLFNGLYNPLAGVGGVPGLGDKRPLDPSLLDGGGCWPGQQPFNKRQKSAAEEEEAKAVAEAVGGITAFASSFGTDFQKTTNGGADNNHNNNHNNNPPEWSICFPLPRADHARKTKDLPLSSFKSNWNNIRTKGMRKELFLRYLHQRQVEVQMTNNKKINKEEEQLGVEV